MKRKFEKHFINYISSPIGQKIGEIWSTNKKVVGAHVDPTQVDFFRDIKFQP